MNRFRNIPLLILLVMMLVPGARTLASAEADGTYRWERMSGTLKVKNDEDYYSYDYEDGLFFRDWFFNDPDFFEKHGYPFPPEGVLAAALGRGIVVRDDRIRTSLTKAQAEIVRVALHDPRLAKLVYFHIKTLPKFRRFRRLDSGVLYARSRQALVLEVGIEADGGVSKASAWADYRARIVGKKLHIQVKFRGRGGPLGEDRTSYDLEGSAHITAIHK